MLATMHLDLIFPRLSPFHPLVYVIPGSTAVIWIAQSNSAAWGLTLTCRVFCQGLAGDGRRRLLQGVCGGGGGCAGAGVVACHVGWRVRWAVVILSVLPLTEGRITVVVLLWETDGTLVDRKTELFEHWRANLYLKIKGKRQKGNWRDAGIDILHQCCYFTVEIQKHKCKHMSVLPYIWTMFRLAFFLTLFCVIIYLYFIRYSGCSCRLTFWHPEWFVSWMNIVSVFYKGFQVGRRKSAHLQNTKWNLLIAESSKRMSRRVCVATCCVLLKPVEFVRELFPAYSPDVVVKVPPWRERDLFTYVYNRWWIIEFVLLQAQDGKKWHIVGRKTLSLVKKTACGGEQRGAWGSAPKSGLIFLLFLPYHWLDQVWWMMEGGKRRVRGGQNLLAKLSEPAECKEDKRLLCVSYWCVWAACCGGGGKGGCTRTEEEGGRRGGAEQQKKKDLKRTMGDFVADFYWKCMFHSSLAQTTVLLRN